MVVKALYMFVIDLVRGNFYVEIIIANKRSYNTRLVRVEVFMGFIRYQKRQLGVVAFMANLQISVKPQNEEKIKNFSRVKMGITK